MIELPITIRPPKVDEIPANSSASKRLEELKTANIRSGKNILSNSQEL